MANRQSLRATARSVVDSFTSLMNHLDGDAVMGHVVRAARETGATGLRLDLLSGATDPSGLLVAPVRESLRWLAEWFPELAAQSQPAVVRAAEMIVTVEAATRRTNPLDGAQEVPFACAVRITDGAGRTHTWSLSDWW